MLLGIRIHILALTVCKGLAWPHAVGLRVKLRYKDVNCTYSSTSHAVALAQQDIKAYTLVPRSPRLAGNLQKLKQLAGILQHSYPSFTALC